MGAYTWASLYLIDILECIYLGNLLHLSSGFDDREC